MPATPFPKPCSTTTTARGAAYGAPVAVTTDDTLPAQGYRLRTGPGGITVTHRDPTGRTGTGLDRLGRVSVALGVPLLLELEPLLAEPRARWPLRSRPGGLDGSLAHIGHVQHDLPQAGRR